MTVDRINLAKRLQAQGLNITQMAKEMKCSRHTVQALLSNKPPQVKRKKRDPSDMLANERFMCVEDFEDLQDRSGFSLKQLFKHAKLHGVPSMARELTPESVNAMLDLIATSLGEREVKHRRPQGTLNQRIRTLWDTTHKGRPMSIAVRVGCSTEKVREVLKIPAPYDDRVVSDKVEPGIHWGFPHDA